MVPVGPSRLELILELARVTVLADFAGETLVRDQLRSSIARLRAARNGAEVGA